MPNHLQPWHLPGSSVIPFTSSRATATSCSSLHPQHLEPNLTWQGLRKVDTVCVGLERTTGEGTAARSSALAWTTPWMEQPGGLQPMGSLRVGHDWVTSPSLSCTGEGNGSPLQCSCLENPRDREAWWAAVYGVAQSRTRLKRLSSSRRENHISSLLIYKRQLLFPQDTYPVYSEHLCL